MKNAPPQYKVSKKSPSTNRVKVSAFFRERTHLKFWLMTERVDRAPNCKLSVS